MLRDGLVPSMVNGRAWRKITPGGFALTWTIDNLQCKSCFLAQYLSHCFPPLLWHIAMHFPTVQPPFVAALCVCATEKLTRLVAVNISVATTRVEIRTIEFP
jgi:hypothetical protein